MRLVLFYLVLLVPQGFLSALLAPVPAPDLFLLAALTLLWRVQPWQLVLVAYGIGILQDMLRQFRQVAAQTGQPPRHYQIRRNIITKLKRSAF